VNKDLQELNLVFSTRSNGSVFDNTVFVVILQNMMTVNNEYCIRNKIYDNGLECLPSELSSNPIPPKKSDNGNTDNNRKKTEI
jgi:hypothetical protein